MTPSPTASDYARAPPPTQPPIPNPIRPGISKFNEALMKSRWKNDENWIKVDEKLIKIELMQSQQNVDENLMKKAKSDQIDWIGVGIRRQRLG
jgi:hypothetical protein